MIRRHLPFVLFALSLPAAPTLLAADLHAAVDCTHCAAWNAPQAPFKLHGKAWYVGPAGLSVVLLETDAGLALFDGALPQSAVQVETNLATLGFDIDDVKWIFVSHAHFDHVGGVAALQQASGATVYAAPGAAEALRTGTVPADDPQAAEGDARFPAVAQVIAVADGETIRIGATAVTAVHTPGHTPGGGSWHWRSCEDGRCVTAVYADSLNAVSSDGFHFSDDPARVAAFEAAIESIGALDCELLIPVHPGFAQLVERRRRAPQAADALLDPQACRRYADSAAERLAERLRSEAASG